MFKAVGSFSVKYRVWVILGWVILTGVMVIFAPALKDVARLGEQSALPAGVDSLKAKEILEQNFPGSDTESNASLVLFNPAGLTQEDESYGRTLRDWLDAEKARLGIASVSSVFDDPQLAEFLISPDRTVMLVQVSFAGLSLDEETTRAVKDIRKGLPAIPADGLEVHVSGEAGMSADLLDAVNKGIDRTTRVTVLLVVVLLLIIYRSPVAALVPLVTIGMAYVVGRGVLAFMAQAGLSVWSQVDAYLVVIVFGVGTDYCLFIMSRLREEMGKQQAGAHVAAIGKIGMVITASAATVIVGFLGLLVGRLEIFATLGPFLATGVFVTLVAALTLTPAIASLFGRRLFWPAHDLAGKGRVGVFSWAGIARMVTSRPALSAAAVVVLLLVPYVALASFTRSFDVLSQLPNEMDSIAGFRALESHYDIGEMMPLTAVVVAPQGVDLTRPESLAALASVDAAVAGMEGVKKVRSPVSADGADQPLLVKNQLLSLATLVRRTALFMGAGGAGAGQEQALVQLLTTTRAYLDEVVSAYPQAAATPAYFDALATLAQLRDVFLAMSQSPPQPSQMSQLRDGLDVLASNLGSMSRHFESIPDAYLLPASLMATSPDAQRLRSFFFSPTAGVVRFSVVLEEHPYSMQAFDTARQVRETLGNSVAQTPLAGATSAVGGATAEFADVQKVTDEDFVRVFGVVLAGVFVVLALLLRSVVAPLYLLLTVLLSYGTTLGISSWLFQSVLHQGGVIYIVPTFLMVILIALGEDYNIFLMSRVKEECESRGSREGVRVAAAATGGIITACGIILAGTFAALTTAPIQTLFQTGAAISIGILVDTFVVRAFLVPAIAATLGKWNWWPRRQGRAG